MIYQQTHTCVLLHVCFNHFVRLWENSWTYHVCLQIQILYLMPMSTELLFFSFHSYARNCTFIYFLLFMCFCFFTQLVLHLYFIPTCCTFQAKFLHERTENRMHCCTKLVWNPKHLLPLRSAIVFDQLISWPVRRSLHTSSLKCRRKRDDSAKNPQQSLPGHHQA